MTTAAASRATGGAHAPCPERDEAARALAAERLRLATLMRSLRMGALVEDEERRIVLANEAFCRIFGVPGDPSAMVGLCCADAGRASAPLFADPAAFLEGVERCLEGGVERMADRLVTVDGRTLERDYVPLASEGPSRAPMGHLWLYRDVTAQAAHEETMRAAKEEAEAANAAKDSFCAILSHELRTPMSAVLGLADILQASPLSREQRSAAEGISRAGRTLLRLVDDLLDHEKIRAGRFVIEPVDADPARAVREAVEVFAREAQAKGLALRLEIAPQVPTWARVDALRLRQIVTNFVSNAIKYTPRGEVSVEASYDARTRRLRIAVHDSGVGVPTWAEPLLFRPFSRIPDPAHARVRGTGLGLVITRELVERMGGTIGYARRGADPAARGDREAGSTFWCEIQLEEGSSRPRAPSQAGVPALGGQRGAGASRGTVLLAEDEPLNRMVARRMLEGLGFEVVIAETGRDAVEAARARRFVAILMDLEMPGMDGLEATRRIRAAEAPSERVPIVAVTASAMASDRDRCLAAGMDEHLAKPISLATLGALLDRRSRARPDAPFDAQLPEAPASATKQRHPTLDRARVERLAGADASPGLLAELIALFRKDATARVRALEAATATPGVAIDRDPVRKLAHALKGASATFGAVRLADCSARIEQAARSDAPDEVLEAHVHDLEAELIAVERALAGPNPLRVGA